jgi:hypothetical protein
MRVRTALLALVVVLLVSGTAVAAGVVGDKSAATDSGETTALAEATVASPAGEVAATQVDDTTEIRYTSPDGDVREEYAQMGVDVSSAVAAETAAVRSQYRRVLFDRRLEGASNRSAVAEQTATAIIDRTETLDQRHADLLAAYGNGTDSTPQLLRGLLQTRAAALGEATLADRLVTTADERENVTLSSATETQLDALDAEHVLLPSPVVDDLEATVTGAAGGKSVYVQASADALVLAAGGEGQTRRASLRGERDESAPNQFAQGEGSPIGNAFQRATQLYPGTYSLTSGGRLDDTAVYRISGDHEAGNLTVYLDGGTTNAFHERQTLDAGQLSTTTTVNTTGLLSLTTESTRPSGPMSVLLADDGEPVADATVRVGNDTAGTTGSDGTLWTTQPVETDRVSATTPDGETVSLTIPDDS